MPRDYPEEYDLPDECPMCGEPNADDDGEPLVDGDVFCSESCRDSYGERVRADEDKLARELSTMCGLCTAPRVGDDPLCPACRGAFDIDEGIEP